MEQQQESSTQQNDLGVNLTERHQMIAETAYFIAEQRGFKDGDTLEDWLQAEAKVDALRGEVAGDQ